MKQVKTILEELEALPKRLAEPGEEGIALEEIEKYVEEKFKAEKALVQKLRGEIGNRARVISQLRKTLTEKETENLRLNKVLHGQARRTTIVQEQLLKLQQLLELPIE